MSISKEILNKIVARIETFEEISIVDDTSNVLSKNSDAPVSEDAYYELEDEWDCGEFYDYVVIKGNYAYMMDAFGDNEIFGNRVLKGSESYEDVDACKEDKRYTIINLD